jgi:hypothetical protein
VIRTDRLGKTLVGADVVLKQFGTGAVGTDRIQELNDVISARRHHHLARQLEVFRGPAPRPQGEPAEDADLFYVVSVLVPGTTLATVATTASLDQVLAWIRQVGEALDYLHAEVHEEGPVVHRDIKPSNIVITPSDTAVLIDPGLARLTGAEATGTPWGSPGYLPPETIDPSQGGPASDRWQLAATLVAVLLGDPPGSDADLDDLRARLVERLHGEVARPGPLANALVAMLAPDPADRPTSASAWAAELAALAAAGRKGVLGNRVLVVAGGVAMVALGVLMAVVLLDDGDGGGDETAAGTGPAAEMTVTAVIDNRVTDGAGMREDTPAYLSEVTENFCRPNGCDVPDTDLVSGDEITLVCHTVGQRTTNGDDTNTNDDDNPDLYESRLWYYAIHDNGNEGYIAESWIRNDFRGGLDLPLC